MPSIQQVQRLPVTLGGDAGEERRVGQLGVPGCVTRLARTLDLYVAGGCGFGDLRNGHVI
jgi:hypothetical protein